MVDGVSNIPGGQKNVYVNNDGTINNTSGTTEIDQTKLLDELLAYLNNEDGGTNGVDGRPGPKGAPALEKPGEDFSADELSLMLMALNSKSQEGQLKVAKSGMEMTQKQKEGMHAKAMEKLKEALDKASDAADKEKVNKILGWVGKIAAFVVAVVATVAAIAATVLTAGAAAPLLALAIVGLVSTGFDLANQISQSMEPKGPVISISKFLTDGATALLKAFNVPEDQAKILTPIIAIAISGGTAALFAPDLYGAAAQQLLQAAGVPEETAKWIGLAVTIVVTVVTAVAMCVAGGAATGLQGAAKVAQLVGRIAQTAGQIVGGATNIAGGAIKISSAHDRKLAEVAQADKADIDAVMTKLRTQMEEQQDQIKELLERLDESAQMVSQMLQSAGQTRMQQVRNIV